MPFLTGRFQYEVVGGREIYFDASDYQHLELELRDLAGYIEAVAPPMRAAKAIARNDMKERFRTQTEPGGKEWKKLSPDYAMRKAKKYPGRPILTLKTPLRRAATSEAAWSISGESLFFNTAILPRYWRIHQKGSEGYAEFFSHDDDDMRPFREKEDGNKEANIPPRPFIGLSVEASSEIFWTFDTWFEKGVNKVERNMGISGSGTLQTRNKLGQFGPKPPR
jgi:phage gpG-like protein